jgi:hypothetical protein
LRRKLLLQFVFATFKRPGIPCHHQLYTVLENNGRLQISDFHDQWKLNPEDTATTTAPINPLRSSPRKVALEQIQKRLCAIDPDQVPAFLQKIEEATNGNIDGISNKLVIVKK